MDVVLGFLAGVVVGAITMLFYYRNNKKDVDPIADKVDNLYDKVEELTNKVKEQLDKN